MITSLPTDARAATARWLPIRVRRSIAFAFALVKNAGVFAGAHRSKGVDWKDEPRGRRPRGSRQSRASVAAPNAAGGDVHL